MNIENYLDFIEDCRTKDYSNLVTHKHHIIPKHFGGTNEDTNLIELSINDHYQAHIILAECFEPSDEYYRTNMASAVRIKNSRFLTKEQLENFSESMKGYNNPNYGNKWSDEQKKHLSIIMKDNFSDLEFRKKYMKPKSDTSKMGKYNKKGENNPFYNKKHTEETRKILSEKRKGKKPSNIKPFYIDGIRYLSLKDAENATGIKSTTIRHRIISKNKKYENYKYENQ